MEIYFHAEDVALPKLEYSLVEKWIFSVIADEGVDCGDLNFIFCSDQYLLDLNKQYLNHDYYTDIITFDYSEESTISGDIFISTDRVGENAVSFGVDVSKELLRICVHGVLHLIGYKDKSVEDKEIMTSKENDHLTKYPNY